MKICHIQGIFSPEHGGPTQSLSNYCTHQSASGHQVSVWALEGFPGTSPAVRLPPPIEMHVCPVSPPKRLGVAPLMERQLRAADSPDIFHLHGAWFRAMHYGAAEAQRRKTPYMLELMGMYEPWALRQNWISKKIARIWFQDSILHSAACLHVNSGQEAQYLREMGFRKPIAVIPVGVDISKIEALVAGQKSESPWTEISGRSFILCLSRLHPKKGIDLLIRSWAGICKSSATSGALDDKILVIAGTGPKDYVDSCKQLAATLGIADRCLWTGHVNEGQKSWLFSNALCYALPTSSENFGNVIAEALVHGTPVITTRHTPWKELSDRQCGWYIDNTESELSQALSEAAQMMSSERKAMGARGGALVRERYSLELTCRKILETYEWLLGGGARPEHVQAA